MPSFKNIELDLIQDHLNSISGSVLLCSNDSAMIDLLSKENLKILSNSNQSLSDHIDNLLFTNTLNQELSKYNEKFDCIFIHDLLEHVKYPELFLKELISILNETGIIICSISNFFHIENIFNILIKNISHNEFFNATKFYNLEKFQLFLNVNDMHITKVSKIQYNFPSNTFNLDEILIPSELVSIFQKFPDYDISQYILMIGKGKTIPSETLGFASQFPKNYILPKLQEFFNAFLESEKSIMNKDELISGLNSSIKKQSTLIQGHESSIKKQSTLIQGHENSIREQQEYIKNLEEHIHNLESQLKKFQFWKR